jgi:hypothetical protein
MQFTDSSLRQVVCEKRKIPLLQTMWLKQEYQFDVFRATNSAGIKKLLLVK